MCCWHTTCLAADILSWENLLPAIHPGQRSCRTFINLPIDGCSNLYSILPIKNILGLGLALASLALAFDGVCIIILLVVVSI